MAVEKTVAVSHEAPKDVVGSPSWDPYDVWLTRVKQPRDLLPPRAEAIAANSALASPDTQVATARQRRLRVLPRAT